jgi:hypothetical protein
MRRYELRYIVHQLRLLPTSKKKRAPSAEVIEEPAPRPEALPTNEILHQSATPCFESTMVSMLSSARVKHWICAASRFDRWIDTSSRQGPHWRTGTRGAYLRLIDYPATAPPDASSRDWPNELPHHREWYQRYSVRPSTDCTRACAFSTAYRKSSCLIELLACMDATRGGWLRRRSLQTQRHTRVSCPKAVS